MARGILVVGTRLDRVEANIFVGVKHAGFDIRVMTSPASPFQEILRQAEVPIIPLECKGRLDPKAIISIRRQVNTGAYGILHCFSNRTISNSSIALAFKRIKQVAYRGTVGHVSRWDPLSWLTYLNPRLSTIVCVSEAVRSYLLQMVPERKLVTIRKGHDPEWYTRASERALDSYGIPANAFVISCVANMRPVKGVPYLLDAFDQLPDEINAHLLLVGTVDSSSERALKSERKRPDRIHAVGFQKNPEYLVSQSDCFVMPSIEREGLPKALLEAMGVGVACIATEVGGMPEVISGGHNGLLVPPKDSFALAEAIESLARDGALREGLASAASETLRGPLSIEKAIEKTVALYSQLLSSPA